MTSDTTLVARATDTNVREALRSIPKELCNGPATSALMEKCGAALLEHVRVAFMVKARGGTDEAGDRWVPLSPKTVAYSRRGDRTKVERGREGRPSQALTKKQQDRWWDLYRQGLAISKGDKGSAARRAWAILKNEGATTLFDKYGHRRVMILYNTGQLFNSISLRVNRSEARISTDRRGAAAHHNGVPGRLPQRRLWPGPRRWPKSWWADITDLVVQGVIDMTAQQVRGAK